MNKVITDITELHIPSAISDLAFNKTRIEVPVSLKVDSDEYFRFVNKAIWDKAVNFALEYVGADKITTTVIGMDDECINLCAALNKLPGIETYESCSGHGEAPFRIWFNVNDFDNRSLLLLSRLMSCNYYLFNLQGWSIKLDHKDINPQMSFLLEGPAIPSCNADELAKKIEDHINSNTNCYNILYDK